MLFHVANLHRGGMGAEQVAIWEIESVLHIPRWVVWGGVQGFKVVVVAFHFRAGGDGVAQSDKNI